MSENESMKESIWVLTPMLSYADSELLRSCLPINFYKKFPSRGSPNRPKTT